MCGIAGVVGHPSQYVAGEQVARMTAALERRGPDSEGLLRSDGAVLGHRRLAIFDLSSAGAQPMSSPDGRVAVVFNGAIYNFRELRRELEADGDAFRSETDTEVLLQGYRAWGVDGLVERLRGMFAFALWDAESQTAYLVRDRLGVKPLVYVQHGSTIAFASTPRALRVSGIVDGSIDARAVAEFLEHGYVSEAHSIYAGVCKLPPASIAEWRAGTLRIRSYWTPPVPGTRQAVSFGAAVDRAEELLLAAVQRRLDADVPVGALLSGGVDSGLVCWAIARLGGRVRAFTVGTPGVRTDETADARETAREIGIAHEILHLTDADSADLSRLVSAYAEPFAVESALGMLAISKTIADTGTKVLLTGDGGDDVFLGYPRHKQLLLVERLARRMPTAATPIWRALRAAVPHYGSLRRGIHLADYVVGGLPAYLDANDGLPFYARHALLAERLKGAVEARRGTTWSVISARSILTEYLEHDIVHQFVSEYLTKVDGATMYYALEARSPFLDQDLWEFAAALPTTLRMHGGELKAILREIARRRIGPRVAGLRKQGFAVPVQRWLAGRWREALDRSLHDSELERLGWIRADNARDLLGRVRVGGEVPKQLWYIFVLEQWLRAERTWSPPAVEERAGDHAILA